MPVKLRLQRWGRKASPFYAIVAADSRAKRDGKFIEKLGHYDPVTAPAKVYVDHEAAIKWLEVGAQPTNTVRHLLRHTGVTLKWALIKQGKTEEEMDKIYSRWREEKDGKSKKKVISVDIHGNPLEPVPDSVKKEHAGDANQAPPVEPKAAEPEVEETPKEETPAEETPAAENSSEEESPAKE